MPEQILIGNFTKGLRLDKLPFNIDNDTFPTMFNFYSWRGRAKRKRGTIFIGQLQVQVQSVASNPTVFQKGPLTLSNGFGNLLGFLGLTPTTNSITNITNSTQAVVTVNSHTFSVGQIVQFMVVAGMTQINGLFGQITAKTTNTITVNINSTSFSAYSSGGLVLLSEGPSIVLGSINVVVAGHTYTEPSTPNGTLLNNGTPDGSFINYNTGLIFIVGGGSSNLIGNFSFFPDLPVMGLEDWDAPTTSNLYPLLLAFDTDYSYQLNQTGVPFFYNVNYFKATNFPFLWSGANFQQFWTTNYSGALWATNGKPGFNFLNGTYVSGSGSANITFNFKSGGINFTTLVVGDLLWFNEWGSSTDLNGLVGTVSSIAGAASGNYVVTFANSETAAGTGIVQTLTNTIPGQDGIKWYDGDMTNGTGIPTSTLTGWVNFAPPLTATTVSIDNSPAALYYLVGATAILPFKDRLLFFAPTIMDSGGVNVINLIDTVLWSQNGTPYYTTPVPVRQTAAANAWYVDQTGLAGYLPAGISQPIITVGNNEDVLLIGFGGDGRKVRFVYTGNDLQPFLFFNINSELPSSSTFSSVILDKGMLDIGQYGLTMTDQQSSARVDLDIPDEIFQIQALNNGAQRVNAVRDFFKEWIYFAYPVNDSQWVFPTQSFLFNYRNNTWSILYENFTHQGTFRFQNKNTWSSIGMKFRSWAQWREAWNSGSTTALFPSVVGGNPQGYVLQKGIGTGEARSGTIDALMNIGGNTQITSVNHCVTAPNTNTGTGDYILITGAIGIYNVAIIGITIGNPTIIQATNIFSAGQNVFITGVLGTTELNNGTFNIISATATTITINATTTNAYISGGNVAFAFNNQIFQVTSILNPVTMQPDPNNFVIDAPFPLGTYVGGGQYTRLSHPLIQTKQFNPYWDQGRQARLSVQKYLLDFTDNSSATINIYLSMDPDSVWNNVKFNPAPNGQLYSQTIFTCPESSNIGLTPANTNLQMPTAESQFQIWHRFNTSMIGDTIQIGLTLNDAQMRSQVDSQAELTLHAMHLIFEKGPHLA